MKSISLKTEYNFYSTHIVTSGFLFEIDSIVSNFNRDNLDTNNKYESEIDILCKTITYNFPETTNRDMKIIVMMGKILNDGWIRISVDNTHYKLITEHIV